MQSEATSTRHGSLVTSISVSSCERCIRAPGGCDGGGRRGGRGRGGWGGCARVHLTRRARGVGGALRQPKYLIEKSIVRRVGGRSLSENAALF